MSRGQQQNSRPLLLGGYDRLPHFKAGLGFSLNRLLVVSAGTAYWQQGALNFQTSPPLRSQSSPLWIALLPLKSEVRYSRRCHLNQALLVALVALEDPAPLVDLSENTQECSPQTVCRTGLPGAAGDPESKSD